MPVRTAPSNSPATEGKRKAVRCGSPSGPRRKDPRHARAGILYQEIAQHPDSAGFREGVGVQQIVEVGGGAISKPGAKTDIHACAKAAIVV